jgi:hypothetical protein
MDSLDTCGCSGVGSRLPYPAMIRPAYLLPEGFDESYNRF